MSVNVDLLHDLLNQVTQMISTRQDMIKWTKEFISDVRTQEIAGVVSFFGLFTPFAPLAVGGLVGAGAAGVATTIGDLIANKVKSGNLDDRVKVMTGEESKLEALQKKMDQQAKILAKELKISIEDARLYLLVGVPKMMAQAGIAGVGGYVKIVEILPHLKAIQNAMKFGASFTQAVKLSSTVFTGARPTVIGVEGVAAAGTTIAVTTAAKALGGFGAAIGVADAIYSWSTKNPNRKSAVALLPTLEQNLQALKKTKTQFLELQKI